MTNHDQQRGRKRRGRQVILWRAKWKPVFRWMIITEVQQRSSGGQLTSIQGEPVEVAALSKLLGLPGLDTRCKISKGKFNLRRKTHKGKV